MTEPLQEGDPERLGRYRLLGRLGRGGMGTVYLAADETGRKVAVKVINPEAADVPQFRERFRREVAAARRVRRFCTAPIVDAALTEPPWYVVTEYVPGPTLQEAVAESGPLHGADLEGLAVGIATALSAIHEAGLVHRDLKPSNVLLSPVGPRVIDFGIARALDEHTAMTRTGQLVGTPAYLAPELITGGEVTPAADVFSWGCVVAFAGTGRTPFGGRSVPEILHRVAYDPPNLDGLDPALLPLVSSALTKDPARRPSVPDLLAALTGRAPAEPSPAADPPPPAEPSPPTEPPFAAGPAPSPGLASSADLTPPASAPFTGSAPSTEPSSPGQPPRDAAGPTPPSPDGPSAPPRRPEGAAPPPFGTPPAGPGAVHRGGRSPLMTLSVVAVLAVLLVTGAFTARVVLHASSGKAPPPAATASSPASTASDARSPRTGEHPAAPSPSATDAAKAATDVVDPRLHGTWEGEIVQESRPQARYEVTFVLTERGRNDRVGQATYPELGCIGGLTLTTASPGRLVVEQRLTEGMGPCGVFVDITFTLLDDGSLHCSFRGFNYAAEGVLRKTES